MSAFDPLRTLLHRGKSFAMRTAALLCLALVSCSSGERFDRAAWKNADLSGRARADMLEDFLDRYPLKGMTRRELIALLGEPSARQGMQGAEMVYVLGNDGSYFPIDNEWLLIDLDRQGRVSAFHRSFD